MSPAANGAGAETLPAMARLYELVLENGRSASLFVWRIRYALAHKGIAFESVPLGSADIAPAFGGRIKTVPVLERGAVRCWPRIPPDRAIASPAEREMVRLMDAWFSADIARSISRLRARPAARRLLLTEP